MNLSQSSKILILRFSSLGDVLLTTPVLRAVKKNYPNSEIDFVVREEYSDVLRYNPLISKLYVLKRDRENEILNELSGIEYDIVIDLQNNLRSKLLRRKINHDKMYVYNKPSLKKFLLVNFKINLLTEKKSIPQHYAESIHGLQLDENGLDLYLPDEIKPNIRQENITVGLCPGSRHYTKMWPEKYFIELGKFLVQQNFEVAIFGGKSDKKICGNIQTGIEKSKNLCSQNDLYQTAADMRMCKVIVTNDSGLMHVASAMGVPVIAIFGSTVREFGFSPYNVTNVVLENNLITCRPCTHIGRDSCPKNHFRCMKEIEPKEVFTKILELVNS